MQASRDEPEPYTLNPRREPLISVDTDTWASGSIFIGIGDRHFGLDLDEAEGLADAILDRVGFLRTWREDHTPHAAAKVAA